MNRLYEHKADADDVSVGRLKSSPEILEEVPALKEDVDVLDAKSARRRTAISDFATAASGKSADKKKAEHALFIALKRVLGKLYYCGSREKDSALMELTDVSDSAIHGMRDGEFLLYAQTILTRAKAQTDRFAHCGLKPWMIEALEKTGKVFNAAKGDSTDGHMNKTDAHKLIVQITAEIDAMMLDSIDSLIDSMKEEYPDFCRQYMDTRVVNDKGIRHRKPPEPPAPEPSSKEPTDKPEDK